MRGIPRDDECARYAALGAEFRAFNGPNAVMLDSSKVPEGLGYAARSAAFDIRVLHIVRDVRAWLVSMRKSYLRNMVAGWAENCARDGALKGTAKYLMRHPVADARRWRRLNAEVGRVAARNGLPVLLVSYERLCLDTDAVRAEIEAFIGTPVAPYGTPRSDDNHSIFGNRMRFEPEKLSAIRYDHGWLHDDSWLAAYALSPKLRRLNRCLGQSKVSMPIGIFPKRPNE